MTFADFAASVRCKTEASDESHYDCRGFATMPEILSSLLQPHKTCLMLRWIAVFLPKTRRSPLGYPNQFPVTNRRPASLTPSPSGKILFSQVRSEIPDDLTKNRTLCTSIFVPSAWLEHLFCSFCSSNPLNDSSPSIPELITIFKNEVDCSTGHQVTPLVLTQ